MHSAVILKKKQKKTTTLSTSCLTLKSKKKKKLARMDAEILHCPCFSTVYWPKHAHSLMNSMHAYRIAMTLCNGACIYTHKHTHPKYSAGNNRQVTNLFFFFFLLPLRPSHRPASPASQRTNERTSERVYIEHW